MINKLQKVKEALEFIVVREDFSFAECTEAELIWNTAKEALTELKEFMEGETAEEKLWQLLDDIDTASDMFKPEQTGFYKYVMAKAQERHRYLVSDGFNLRHRNET